MIFVFLDPDTNLMTTASLEPEGIDAIEVDDEFFDINSVYISEGRLLPVPPAPSAFHWFDPWAGIWVDDRSPADALAAARAGASMSRSDFVLAIKNSSLVDMSIAEAGQAARGEIPAPIETIIASLPAGMQLEAVVRWSGATMIERSNPILAVLAEALSITDAQLDALFDIAPPPDQPQETQP